MNINFLLGYLAALLILSLKTGIILGSSWLSLKKITAASMAFGAALLLIVILLAPYAAPLNYFTQEYTFSASLFMAGLLVYLGLNSNSHCCGIGVEEKTAGIRYFAAFLPCPFCLIAMALSIILFKEQTGITHRGLELIVSMIFTGVLIALAYGTRWLINRKNINPGDAFNALLLFMGLMTVVLSLFIPNFVASAQMNFTPLAVDSFKVTFFVLLFFFCLAATGYFYSRFVN
ncbi:MAG: hypothetical protein CVU88_06455 [Firmicutes bacterium HGW-Firmicutes-13]|nr:MAG: hypothetical protein CVU88_06455 [Firmicutes bacterium HGW-Firmicutes-13]